MRYRQAIALLALVGLFVALYLWLHALGFGGGGPIKCGTGGCDTVQASPWAVLLGLPVAFYGVVGYLAVFVVALVALRPAGLLERKWDVVLVGLATVGVLFTAYLTYLELFVIHAICRWCVGSAVIITAIWVVAVLALRRPGGRTAPVGVVPAVGPSGRPAVRFPATRIDPGASPPPPDRRA